MTGMSEPQQASPEQRREEVLRRVARLRRQMHLLVGLVTTLGVAAMTAVLVYGKYRHIYQEHYDFRRSVRVGMPEKQVRTMYGEPYRVFWSRLELEAVISGRGHFKTFDAGDLGGLRWTYEPPGAEGGTRTANPEDATRSAGAAMTETVVRKVLHYRPDPDHGEFVLIGEDGRVLKVFTGRP